MGLFGGGLVADSFTSGEVWTRLNMACLIGGGVSHVGSVLHHADHVLKEPR